jgi:putative integral membrane protein (TIGR02587 family)
MATTTLPQNQWAREIDDLIRGASGGFLFGIPLLYTMEVWWIGSYATPFHMLVALATTFCVVLLLNQTAGFRRTEDIRLRDAAMDTVEALAIGILCTATVLFLLREITTTTPLNEVVGKIVFESVPFSLGVALTRQFLSAGDDSGEDSQAQQRREIIHDRRLNATLADVGATLIGALIIAFNIAPTDEIPMLTAALSPPWVLALMAASLLISYGIVFEANFANQERREQQEGLFQRPLSETIMSYLVSLAAAMFMLWFFRQLTFDDPWQLWLNYTLVLGLPATVGGAAGRLAV